MLFIFNPWAKQLLVLLSAVSGSAFTEDPGRCLAFSLQLLLALALELELADGESFPSVQHWCMLLRRWQGCDSCPRSDEAPSLVAAELCSAVSEPNIPCAKRCCGASLSLAAGGHRGPLGWLPCLGWPGAPHRGRMGSPAPLCYRWSEGHSGGLRLLQGCWGSCSVWLFAGASIWGWSGCGVCRVQRGSTCLSGLPGASALLVMLRVPSACSVLWRREGGCLGPRKHPDLTGLCAWLI